MSLVGVINAIGGAESVAFDENAGVIGVVCTIAETAAGCAGIDVAGAAAAASVAALADMASLVASTMLFLASLNCISIFPNSAFISRNCVSIDSFSAAALVLLPFLFDVTLPCGTVVAAASSDGGAVGWMAVGVGVAVVLVAFELRMTMSLDGQFGINVDMTTL